MAEMTFEEAVVKLDHIVKKMENEKLTLDESIKLYESGVKLSAFCKNKLENAKIKIESFDSGNADDEKSEGV